MKFNTRQFNHDFTLEMLQNMPKEKKEQLLKAIERNAILTTYYGLDYQTVNVYKEGYYLEFYGCRTAFKLWIADNDGEFGYGNRKPKESKLSFLHCYNSGITEHELLDVTKELWNK